MTSRREVLALAGVAAIGWPVLPAAGAERARVALLGIRSAIAPRYLDAFREGLRRAGSNAALDDRFLSSGYEDLAANTARALAERLDILLCFGFTSSMAAAKATRTVPVVFIVSSDPVQLGLVDSLSRPGRNVTGVAAVGYELVGKRLELLAQLRPGMRRVGFVFNRASSGFEEALKNYRAAAAAVNLSVVEVEIRTASDIDGLAAAAIGLKLDGWVVGNMSMLVANRTRLVAEIARSRLPAVYGVDEYVEAGGLLYYGPSFPQLFAKAASYVGRIAAGAKPADLPVEEASVFELALNLATARAQRIAIPPALVARADRVIEAPR